MLDKVRGRLDQYYLILPSFFSLVMCLGKVVRDILQSFMIFFCKISPSFHWLYKEMSLSSSTWISLLPNFFPLALAMAIPSAALSLMMDLSNTDNAAKMVRTSLPEEVVVSTFSFRDLKSTFLA